MGTFGGTVLVQWKLVEHHDLSNLAEGPFNPCYCPRSFASTAFPADMCMVATHAGPCIRRSFAPWEDTSVVNIDQSKQRML